MLRYAGYCILLLIMAGIVYTFIARGEYPSNKRDIANGKTHFIKYCSSCHGLEEDGFGPPLGGITDLLPREPLIKFIRNPSKVIASGDARAVSQLARYKQTMPSFDWMEETMIREILGYINHETKIFHLEAKPVAKPLARLTGRLVAPVKKSEIKIELEKVVQIPRIEGTFLISVLSRRPHPYGDKGFCEDQNGIIIHHQRQS